MTVRTRVAAAALALPLLVLLASCTTGAPGTAGGARTTAPAPSPTAPTAAAPEASPSAPAPAIEAAAFLTADTACTLDAGLECGLLEPAQFPVPPEMADHGVPCQFVVIPEGGTAGSLACITDARDDLPAAVGPLGAGTTVIHGDFTCSVLDAGVRCTSTTGAHAELTPTGYDVGP